MYKKSEKLCYTLETQTIVAEDSCEEITITPLNDNL